MNSYHVNFERAAGPFRIKSYGGGSPRFVDIEHEDERWPAFHGLSMEDIHDLRHLIDRLISAVE